MSPVQCMLTVKPIVTGFFLDQASGHLRSGASKELPVNTRTVPEVPAAPPLLERIPGAARLLSLGVSETYRLVLSGELASIKHGRSRLIPRSAIDALVAQWIAEAEAVRGGGAA